MTTNTPLIRPTQSQVKIEPTAKSALSDGFNYPTFKLLNKQARVAISQPYAATNSTHYHVLAIANSRGWFGAARFNGSSYELVFSTLEDLRSSSKTAKETADNEFPPKRTLPLAQGKPNILAFANHDSRLFVGLEQGVVLVFDTATLFSPGQGPVQPLRSIQLQSSALRQIAPNPGTEPNLVDRVAIVGDGTAQVFNMELEPQGGWTASDAKTNPVAVAWSPKGKHLAIGLQTGDILTFALTNMTTPHKHLPPTYDGALVSLSWTGPGHTFRTSYSQPSNPGDLVLHIVSLDTKTSTGVYYSLTHPFPLGDRAFSSPYILQFPKWDEDASAAVDHHKSLLIFGDSTSVDLEVLAHEGNTWYQQSQENPVSLPLNKSMDDTTLLSLDADLTDITTSTPIVYVYLDDGTVQGWYLEHSIPYPLMVNPQATPVGLRAPGPIQTDTSMSTEQDEAVKPTPSAFSQPVSSSNAFGQPSFGSTPTFGSSGFGQQSTFGQTSSLGGGGFAGFASSAPSPFGQSSSVSPFGQASAQPTTSPFGQATTQPGSTSPFGAGASGASTSPFGSFGGGSSAFGGGASTSAFGSFGTANTNSVFGQGSFGSSNANTSPSVFGSTLTAPSAADMTREASMADETPTFGGLSLGSSHDDASKSKPSGGIFGSFGTTPSTTQAASSSAFGNGGIKPATGFGAFGNVSSSPFNKPSDSGSSSMVSAFAPAPSQPTSTPSPAFGKSSFGQPAFGQSGFGQSGFGAAKPAFGQPSFGQTSFGSAPSTGGFTAFANKPTSFTSAAAPKEGGSSTGFGSGTTSGGFGGFASSSTGGFTSALKSLSTETAPTTGPPQPQSSISSSPFASTGPGAGTATATPAASVFGDSTPSTTSAFGNLSTTPAPQSVFGSTTPSATPVFGGAVPASSTAQSVFGKGNGSASIATPTKPPSGISSPPSSPESTPAPRPTALVSEEESPPTLSAFKSSQPPVVTGAFGNLQSSPSAFRPASGFGAFGATSPSSSPFFKKPEEKAPAVSAFAPIASDSKGPAPSSFSPKATTTPTFGSTSLLGAAKPFLPPATPPSPTPAKVASGGFGAFSAGPTAFSSFTGANKSFSDLLKTGGEASKDPSKPSVQVKIEGAEETPTSKGEGEVYPSEPAKVKGEGEKPAVEAEKLPSPVAKIPEPVSPQNKVEDQSKVKKPASPEGLLTDTSFGDISSAGSSFVDVKAETKAQDEGEEDDGPSFLSDDYRSDGSYEEEDEGSDYVPSDDHETDEEEEGEEDEEEGSLPGSPPEPAAIPLPESRSTTATPQPEVPNIRITPSAESEPLKERAASTTPPGTPDKESAKPTPERKSPSPSPTAGSAASPFNLGLGRPSTRPARSSPLANAPLSGADDEDEDKTVTTATKPTSASAKSVPFVFSAKEPIKKEMSPEGPSNKTPKTPTTVLPTFEAPKSIPPMPSTPFLAPATPPARPFSSPAAISADKVVGQPPKLPPSATSSFFETSSPASLFSTPEIKRPASEPILFGKPATSPAPSAAQEPKPFNLPPFNLKPSQPASTPGFPTTPFPSTSQQGVPGVPPLAKAPSGATTATAPSFFGGQNFKITPQPAGGAFGSLPSQAPSPPPGGLFTTSSTRLSPVPSGGLFAPTPAPTPPPPAGGLFTLPTTPAGGLFTKPIAPAGGSFGPPKPASAFGQSVVVAPKPTPAPPPELTMEEGMQKECALLIINLNKEFDELRLRAQQVTKKREELNKSAGGSWERADLGDSRKWNLSDIKQFGQVMQKFGDDLKVLKENKEKVDQAIRDLDSSMLKAGTRREEIARFNKAQNDADFAKMLRSRTLGPEHSETQIQLRRNIRAMRDRINKLESNLQESKKKLAQSVSGRPSIKAPTLDIVNRTFRNIELAISQQGDDVSKLSSRIAGLNLNESPGPSTPARDSRLPDPIRRRPYNVTPNVAATTAAALNAERSAQKLKKALLNVRKEPLLNVKVTKARPPPVAFNTPQSTPQSTPQKSIAGGTTSFAFQISGPLFTPAAPETPPPNWSLPDDDFSPTAAAGSGGRRGAGSGTKKHSTVHLKRTTAGTPPVAAPSFDWGPLPTFTNPPLTALAASFTRPAAS